MKSLVALIIALVAITDACVAGEPLAQAKYRTDFGSWITVSAMVDGEGPFDFIIDTGTTHTLIFQNLADRLGVVASGASDRRVFSIGAEGNYQTFNIGNVAIGKARLDDVVSVVLPDWPVGDLLPAGILGLDFLERFVVVVDSGSREVLFYEHDNAPDFPSWNKVKLKPTKFISDNVKLYTLTGFIGRRTIEFMFDLGASGTVINDPALGKLVQRGKARGFLDPVDRITVRVVGALDDMQKTRALRIDEFRAGEMVWRDPVIAVYNATMFTSLDRERTPFGLFGSDLLRGRSFMMDFDRGELLIGPITGDGRAARLDSLDFGVGGS